MIPDANILTTILSQCHTLLNHIPERLTPFAIPLLFTLIVIDIAIKAINFVIGSATQQGNEGLLKSTVILDSVITYGFFIYLVFGIGSTTGYTTIVNAVQEGFVFLGLKASGSGMTPQQFSAPSQIASRGMQLAWGLIYSPTQQDVSLTARCMIYLSGLGIILSFFLIAIRVFVLQIVFGIVAGTGLILIPFGVWDQTKFISEKVKNMVFRIGLKFLFMSFVVGLVDVVTRGWSKLTPDAGIQQAAYVLVGSIALAMLTKAADRLADMGGSHAAGAVMGAVGAATSKAAYAVPKAKAAMKAIKAVKKG